MPKVIKRNNNKRSNNMASINSKLQSLKINTHVQALRLNMPKQVPAYTMDPPVKRYIRMNVVLTSADPTCTVTPHQLANLDGTYYLGSSAPRYLTIRVISTRVWFENPPNSLTLSSPGFYLTDIGSNAQFRDSGTVGQQYACISYQLPVIVRYAPVSTSSTVGLFTVASDQAITTGQTIKVIIDTLVELR